MTHTIYYTASKQFGFGMRSTMHATRIGAERAAAAEGWDFIVHHRNIESEMPITRIGFKLASDAYDEDYMSPFAFIANPPHEYTGMTVEVKE